MKTEIESIIAEIDSLIEMEAKLHFARDAFNGDEAERYGVRLLDFMRKRGVTLRAALGASHE